VGKRLGVLVVDDSPICQAMIRHALQQDPELEVVGIASDGEHAIAEAKRLKPAVITMDIEMPGMDGLTAVERIMAEVPTPILVLTGAEQHTTKEAVGRALELGALALQVKPPLESDPAAWRLAREVKLLASVAVIRHVRGRHRPQAWTPPAVDPTHPVKLVAIGSSTGGPQVIHRLLAELPRDFPAPIAIVQHINASFTESLTHWLAAGSPLNVRLACDGDRLLPGEVLIAPPDHHLTVSRGRVQLKPGPTRDGHIPSASTLLESAGLAFGPGAVGVVLTGMGSDGAEGLATIKRQGGRTIAQSKESCVVFGMPAAAIALNCVDHVVAADELSAILVRLAKGLPVQAS
jgi:two-component system chemotaxis response regulator CheB